MVFCTKYEFIPQQIIKMRLKLKQSKDNTKQSLLPPILNFHSNRYSSRQDNTNRSLPKINYNAIDAATQKDIDKNKVTSVNKHPIKDRLKAMCLKINKQEPKAGHERFFSNNQVDNANLTNNFQRQIDKNLKLIKQQKQNQRKKITLNKQECISQRKQNKSYNFISNKNEQAKQFRQEQVFTKINQIIQKSQSKQKKKECQAKPLYSPSSVNINKSNYQQNYSRKQDSKVLKTEGYESQKNSKKIYSDKVKTIIGCELKHSGNYNEWRKLSINSNKKQKMTYEMSSYDLETDRLQKIRNKNDISLKKYFEGKSYLQKLVKSRQQNVVETKKIWLQGFVLNNNQFI